MLFNNIKIGDRLEITLPREKDLHKSYISQVEEIIGNNELLIHMPISYGQLVKLSQSEKYSMLFFTEKGMVQFDAEIVKYKKESEFHYMQIKTLSDGERMQRRDFFRFSCLMPLKFEIIEENLTDEEPPIVTHFDGIIKDLGGGGVRFVTNEGIDEELKVKCVLMINDECIVTIGKILHKQFFPKSNYKYQYRVEFISIAQREQEKIIQYIFNEQRKSVQKNRI